MAEESRAQLKRRPFFKVGALYSGITFAGTLDHQYGMSGRGKGASGPVGKESTSPGHLIVNRASNFLSLQLLQGSPGVFSGTSI